MMSYTQHIAFHMISTAYHAYFDGFQIVAVSFITEFSFRFSCFILTSKSLKVQFVVYYVMTKIDATELIHCFIVD